MQRLEVQLEDDLTGGPAEETVSFGVDGAAYEIDLNARHAANFRSQLARFAEHARPVRGRRSRAARTATSRRRSQAIRAWAGQEGLSIAEHGRLSRDVVRRYELAHASNQLSNPPMRDSVGRSVPRT
jgi:hypothetical protein